MEDKQALISLFRNQQSQYVYYLIALSVACIAFSVNITLGLKLSIMMIPLGISILSWIISIYSGLRFLSYQTAGLFKIISTVQMKEGNHPMTGKDEALIKRGVDNLNKILQEDSKTTLKYANKQNYSLYIGIATFIIWRVIEMA